MEEIMQSSSRLTIKLRALAYHRNGISGAPFHVAIFEDSEEPNQPKVGIVFDDRNHVAVLDTTKLSNDEITFGENSYRGDVFEPLLRKAIQQTYAEVEDLTQIKQGDSSCK
jgi:hypothetical protein